MGLHMSKPLYYYPHYVYVNIRQYIEHYYPIANNQDIHEVYPNIFVGNISTAYNKEILNTNGITHVVTAVSGMHAIYPEDFIYHTVDVLDIKKQDMTPFFNACNQFIDDAITNGGKVYVHCMCGVSRSVSIVLAYLAFKYGSKPTDALQDIQNIRNKANPNPSFRQQLDYYYYYVTQNDNELTQFMDDIDVIEKNIVPDEKKIEN